MSQRVILLLGLIATAGFAALWHGPLGAGEQLARQAEASARRTLDSYELPMIQARMQRSPLARRLVLSGPADDFQRSELVRILDSTPGVLDVRWDPASLPPGAEDGAMMIPLAIEVQLLGLAGFALGFVIGYIVELRRRVNRWKKRI